MHISHGKLVAGFVIATAVLPFMASAQTTDVQSQIQSLLGQIQSLQLQIKALVASSSVSAQTWMASSTPSMMIPPGQMSKVACVTLSRNLGLGARGDDVKNIQQMLAEDPESDFHGGVTGFFGPMTAKAMMNFQMRNGIASSTTGMIGNLTRGFFERRCGKGMGAGGDDRGNRMMPPPTSASTTPPGGHCGGFIQNAPICSAGYHCQLNIMADTGGTCVANGSANGERHNSQSY